MSLESGDSHFLATWGEFTPTLEDVTVIFYLPLCGDHGAMGLVLIKEKKDTTAFECCFKSASKSTYTSWI